MSISGISVDFLKKHIKRHFNPGGRGAILYFHRVLPSPDPFFPDDITVEQLDKLLSCLKRAFEIVPLDALVNTPRSGTGKPFLGLSFDDGYKDNFTLGLPVLERHQVPATFFIATKGIEEGILWQDRVVESLRLASDEALSAMQIAYQGRAIERVLIAQEYQAKWKYLPQQARDALVEKLMTALKIAPDKLPQLMLSKADVVTLSQHPLCTIGAHTHDHVILTAESTEQAYQQIAKSKQLLENWIDTPVSLFCYPNGAIEKDFNQSHMGIASELGFKAAFSTVDGGVDEQTPKMSMPRFMPHRRHPALLTLSALKIAGE